MRFLNFLKPRGARPQQPSRMDHRPREVATVLSRRFVVEDPSQDPTELAGATLSSETMRSLLDRMARTNAANCEMFEDLTRDELLRVAAFALARVESSIG